MKRTNQGGSVLSFIIIGGVLTLLLVGGVYMLRQYNQSSTVAIETPQAPAPGVTAPDESSTKPSKPNASKDDNRKAAESTDGHANAPATMPGTSTGNSTTERDSGVTGPDSTAGSGSSAVDTLPQTGPAQTASALLGVVLLTGASVAYMQSRRHSVGL